MEHSFHDLVRQRVFGIACGYEDCNDAARVGDDPVHKLLVGRDPVEGAALASQSTLSRFENALGPKSLMRMGLALADRVIACHRKRLRGRVKRITVELDPTDDPTHGAQQLSFFNGHYDTWCYLPTAGFIQFDDGARTVPVRLRAASWECERQARRHRDPSPGARAAAPGVSQGKGAGTPRRRASPDRRCLSFSRPSG